MGLNFPTIKKERQKIVNNANRGMDLEEMINQSNEYYLNNDIAVIYKKPTPIQIVKVHYPSRNKAVITEAYYKTPSTTDYNGIYKGKYIDFDAKENHNRTSWPLANMSEHQVKHLKRVQDHGGIAFLLVAFSYYNEYYFLPFDVLNAYWKDSQEQGRKSIPYAVFQKQAYLIKEGFLPRLDYLKIIDEFYL